MLLLNGCKRLAIFAFYDAEGVVDEYILHLLRGMRPACDKQVVVVNGGLTAESEAAVQGCCDEILYRENVGFDISGYRDGFFHCLPLAKAEGYDEILFYNQTVFGPLYPLEELFRHMEAQDMDFWGLTRHKGARKATWDNDFSFGPHVQSYFFAVRRNLFLDERFLQYWQNLPAIDNYWDAVGKHEVVFTKTFAALGFSWGVYVDTEALEDVNDYPLMGFPARLLQATRCPLVKRKSFLMERHSYSTIPQGQAPQDLYDFIRTKTNYPVRLILQNLLRTADISTVFDALTLYFDVTKPAETPSGVATAVWFASDFYAATLCRAVSAQKSDMLICLFASEALAEQCRPMLPAHARCAVSHEHGMLHVLGSLWADIKKYPYLCYLTNDLPLLLDEFHDATTLGLALEHLTAPGAPALLAAREDIGVLVPPAPRHQENFTLGANWEEALPAIWETLDKAGMRVPLSTENAGLVARGGMFCAKTAALAPFSNAPLGTALFAGLYPVWDYMIPLAAQAAGFLTACAASRQALATLYANQSAMMKEVVALWHGRDILRFQQMMHEMHGVRDFYTERRYQMTLEQAFYGNLKGREKLWVTLNLWLSPDKHPRLRRFLRLKDPTSGPGGE